MGALGGELGVKRNTPKYPICALLFWCVRLHGRMFSGFTLCNMLNIFLLLQVPNLHMLMKCLQMPWEMQGKAEVPGVKAASCCWGSCPAPSQQRGVRAAASVC